MSTSLPFHNYYLLFDLKPNFTPEELKKASMKLTRKYHPDKNKEIDTKETFLQIRTAFETLNDETERAAYDRTIKSQLLQKERLQKMDKKRSRMKGDLEERERIHKRRKMEEQQMKYTREAQANMSNTNRANYETSVIQQHVTELTQQLKVKGSSFFPHFILLKWDANKTKYQEENITSIFGSFGAVAQISFINPSLGILVYRREDGTVKLMHSVQEGKKFGAPSNRITVTWVDDTSQETHFGVGASSTTIPPQTTFKKDQKKPSYNTKQQHIPSLEEHLRYEEKILEILRNKY